MARRNLLRSLLSASLLFGSVVAGVLTAPSPAGAVTRVDITVSEQGFSPDDVTVHTNDFILFTLADDATLQHTITSNAICGGGPCVDYAFDRTHCKFAGERTLCLFFSDPGKFEYYDGYAKAAGLDHHGVINVVDPSAPPTTEPPTTTTTSTTAPPSTTTTTTRRVTTTTTTAPTTTTTAPTTIHPFVVPDPAATTTTTAVPTLVPANGAPVAPVGNKDKGKGNDKGNDKGKAKGPSTETPTTAAPAPPDVPTDVTFDPATLTPGPTTLPDTSAGSDNDDEVALDAATVVSLLDHVEKPGDDDAHLMLLALGALALMLVAAAIWGWHNRASRYDPA